MTNDICEKLIHRHPHIYGSVSVENQNEVKKNWEVLKLKEGKKSVLAGVPNELPSLIKAHRLQEKTAGIGFDWSNKKEVWNKFMEELTELDQAFHDSWKSSGCQACTISLYM